MDLMDLFAGQEQRHRCREWTCGHSGGKKGWDELREQHSNIYNIMCKRESWWEAAVKYREPSLVLRDNLEGQDGGRWEGGSSREDIHVYLWLIHVIVWQKPTQYC